MPKNRFDLLYEINASLL